jgi:GGDEF domain-containing protein
MNLFQRERRPKGPSATGQPAGTGAPAASPSAKAHEDAVRPATRASIPRSRPEGGRDLVARSRRQAAEPDGSVLRPSTIGIAAFAGLARGGQAPHVSPPDAYEDLLTGLLGPAAWRRVVVTESARAVRHGVPVTVVLVELTGLERFTRRWGAETATTAVLAMSRALRANSRESDHLARVDVGRFGLLLDRTGEIEAINCVERLRDACVDEMRGAEEDLAVGFGWASPDVGEVLSDAVARAQLRSEEQHV